MDNEIISFTFVSAIPFAEIAARLGLSILLGAAIGIDRELRNKAAGLRTHILVALASTMFTLVTFELFDELQDDTRSPNLDAIRIIEAVTAGVAFLAAGAIIQSRGGVRGLTTGASMWMAGAIGVAAGAGMFVIAIMGTVLAVLVLTLLGWLEARLIDAKPDETAPRDGRPRETPSRDS
ncbi:MAG: MgtC/SapB family protein [Alphaproteobacteria bacterium]